MKKIKLTVDGKLTVNGQEIKLTDEQIKALGLKEKVKPFERQRGHKYHYITTMGRVDTRIECFDPFDNTFYLVANRCNDSNLMLQRAKEKVLSDLLWRFSLENGWSDDLWDKESKKWFIVYDHEDCKWRINYGVDCECKGAIHFVSEEIAKRALNEILLPFERRELEVCKIWEE
nr:MAG TPA: Protein of unknown function (DUF2884) [Caudoviricetes sp.]